MTAPVLHGGETADELLFLGVAVAHVVAYREHERLARIEASNREAARRFIASNREWYPGWTGDLMRGLS